jgi:hypothetical protein
VKRPKSALGRKLELGRELELELEPSRGLLELELSRELGQEAERGRELDLGRRSTLAGVWADRHNLEEYRRRGPARPCACRVRHSALHSPKALDASIRARSLSCSRGCTPPNSLQKRPP